MKISAYFKIASVNYNVARGITRIDIIMPPISAIKSPDFISSFLSTIPVLTSKALLAVANTVQNASDAANPTDKAVIFGSIPKSIAKLNAIGVKIATVAVLLNKFVTRIVAKVIEIMIKRIDKPPRGLIRNSATQFAVPDSKNALPNAIPAPKSKYTPKAPKRASSHSRAPTTNNATAAAIPTIATLKRVLGNPNADSISEPIIHRITVGMKMPSVFFSPFDKGGKLDRSL